MVVVVKTMQIKTTKRLTRSVKYILNTKKTNVPYVETEKDFPVTFTEDKKMMQLVSGHQISNVNYADQEFFLTKIMANASNGNPDISCWYWIIWSICWMGLSCWQRSFNPCLTCKCFAPLASR